MRTILTAPITLFYAPPPLGDPSGDGSMAHPYPSAMFIWELLQGSYDLAALPGLVVTIKALPGTYTQGEIINGPLLGQRDANSVKILGDASSFPTTSPCTYDTRTAGIVALGVNYGAKLSYGGFHLLSGQANVAVDGPGSHLICSDPNVHDTPQDYHLSATNSAKIDRIANNYVASGAASHLNVFAGGNITAPVAGRHDTIMGNSLWFTQGFVSNTNGIIVDSGTTYGPYNTWGPRAIIVDGGYVATGDTQTPPNAAAHFPGSTPVQNPSGYLT